MMERVWLNYYPDGVPSDIDIAPYASLIDIFQESFSQYAKRNAFICMGSTLSYTQLDRYSRSVAAWLQSRGIEKGMRVAIMMPNILQYPVVLMGILHIGAIVVNVNPLYTSRELLHQLNDSGAQAIVILENFATTLEKIVHETRLQEIVVASMGDLLGEIKGPFVNFMVRHVKKMVPKFSLSKMVQFSCVLKEGESLPFRAVVVEKEDLAFLQYTGGTTGVAKGAMLTHANIIANVLQNQAWLQPALQRGEKIDQLFIVCALPLYHVFALTVCGLLGLRVGAVNVLIPNPRDLKGMVKQLSRYQFHIFPGVNTLFNGLLNTPEFLKLDFSHLRISNGGGAAVQKVVAEQWKKVTGCTIMEGYGLSETSPVVTANPAGLEEFFGTIGMPFPSTWVKIIDENEQTVAYGTPGEIAIYGPQVMKGYWQRPEETKASFTSDGFFKSGDIGVMDERGDIRLVDRKKDMILVSGFKVYPNEVEEVVSKCPGVLECACIGVPDERSGEAVKIFVVRKDPKLTKEEVKDYCAQQLTGYKRPQYIEFRDFLPKSNVGKILRRELKENLSVVK
jgi:long-chain acyl-CoA synthetase